MHPVICQLGPVTVYSYGLMMAVAVVVCAFLMSRDARREGLPAEMVYDLVFFTVAGGILGARLFYVILNLSYFLKHPLEIVMLQHGGLAFQGGLVAGVASALIFIRRRNLPLLKTLDLLAPYLALGHAIGRIGCFLNGCCYGRPVSWGIYFPVHMDRLHPTQLYSSAGLFLIFFVVRALPRKKLPDGGRLIAALLLTSALRFFVEFYRADHVPLAGRLSIFQFVSLGVIVLSALSYFFLLPKNNRPE